MHLGLILLLLAAMQSCSDSQTRVDNVSVRPSDPSSLAKHEVQAPIDDPTCCGPVTSEELKKVWQDFIQSGQYRLARKDELQEMGSFSRMPYAYAWGDLGYDKDPSGYYHLAALVVDKLRTDDSRFSLVIFSAPRGKGGKYESYWVLQNKDLSRAFFSGYSGYLELVINQPDGSVTNCDIQWTKKRRYECK